MITKEAIQQIVTAGYLAGYMEKQAAPGPRSAQQRADLEDLYNQRQKIQAKYRKEIRG